MKTIRINNYISDSDFWEIGLITPKMVQEQLESGGDDDVLVEINSGGGVVFCAYEIVNALRAYEKAGRGRVTTRITGMAASAAATIFLSANHREVYKLSYFMQHRAKTFAWGDHEDLASDANLLRQIDEITAADLAELSGRSPKKVSSLLSSSWNLVGGQQIIDEGIATALIDGDAEPRHKLLEQNSDVQPEQLRSAGYERYAEMVQPLFSRPAASTQKPSRPLDWFFNRKKPTQQMEDEVTEQEHETAVKAAIEQERKRVCEIVQIAQNTTGYNETAKQAIDQGKPSEDFAKEICMSGAAKQEEPSATQGPPPSQSSSPSQEQPENDAGVAAAAGVARQSAPPSLNPELEAEQKLRKEIQAAEQTVL